MCGISAIVSGGGAPPHGAIERMIGAIAHRGPDATAARALGGGCTLGHVRLSIIDLTTGAQPMADEGERYWISFNGEIYNFSVLRDELAARGRTFRTHSDTEVLIAGYDEWGPALLDRLRGMFAFAIWDSERRTLFAARDLFGEKPLYYARRGDGTLALASELKAIVAAGVIDPTIDPEAVDAFLTLGYIPPDQTIYREIETLPPAHYLLWKEGEVKVARYWQPRLEPVPMTLGDAAERLRELIAQAVRRQMVADVTVGAFLSGGLDSTTIVAHMQRHSSSPVMTFSVGFGSAINELPYARAVARMYGTDHHEIDLGEPDVPSLIERMTAVYDEPFADTSHIPTYLISRYARQFVKVVLSGDGGDELFGGYWWYPPLAGSERVSFPLLQWLVLRSWLTATRSRNRALSVRSAAAGLAARWDDVWLRDLRMQTVFRERERSRLWARNGSGPAFEPGRYYRPPDAVTGLNRAFYFDLLAYLPGDILVKVDRAAMAHGLETRAPFLDRDLAEFALSLPANLKVRDGETKVVLKEACSRDWPPELRNRAKQGFGSPIGQWLAMPGMQPLLERVFAAGSPLRQLLPGVRGDQRRGRDYKTWVLLTLGLWLEQKRT